MRPLRFGLQIHCCCSHLLWSWTFSSEVDSLLNLLGWLWDTSLGRNSLALWLILDFCCIEWLWILYFRVILVQVVDNCLQLDLAKLLSFVTATASYWNLLRWRHCIVWGGPSARARYRLLLIVEMIRVDYHWLYIDRCQVHVLRLHGQALRPSLSVLLLATLDQLVVVARTHKLACSLRRCHTWRVLSLPSK